MKLRRRARRAPWLAVGRASLGAHAVTSAVFDVPGAIRRKDAWVAATIALAALGGVALSMGSGPPRERAQHRVAGMTIELVAAAPRPPPSKPEPSPRAERIEPRRARAVRPAIPAQAVAVAARENPADQPVDLTSFTIAAGQATGFAGGATSSSGTSTKAVTGPASPDGVSDGTGNPTQPVRLSESEWDCPWPAEADALGIDEQMVVLRVIVRADGTVEAAEAVRDPGAGFASAALTCAHRSRFEPARDRLGNPVRARSGPIRVFFTR
jgi:protein TonB